jgi:hypothetical protein
VAGGEEGCTEELGCAGRGDGSGRGLRWATYGAIGVGSGGLGRSRSGSGERARE